MVASFEKTPLFPITVNDEEIMISINNVSDEGEMDFEYQTSDNRDLSDDEVQDVANEIFRLLSEYLKSHAEELDLNIEVDLEDDV